MAVWTQEDLDALERAIALGVMRVRYQDPAGGLHEKQYNSLDDMLKARAIMRAEMGIQGPPSTIVVRHDRDL
jgi:hypothetical protein